MDANLLNFAGNFTGTPVQGNSNGNLAISQLITQLGTTVDTTSPTPVTIWGSNVFLGQGLPSYSEDNWQTVLDVNDDQSPAIVIFQMQDDHVSRATEWIDTELIIRVRLQCLINVLGSDNGNYPAIQSLRRNITRATLRSLRPKTVDNPTGWDFPALNPDGQYPYWLTQPQTGTVVYGDNLNNIFQNFPVVPPWWTWHINLAFSATNV